MVTQMRFDDEVRLTLLKALLKRGSVEPVVQRLKRETGFHKATIKSSLDYLEKSGLVVSYGPKVIFRKFGYNLEILELLQMDLSQKAAFDEFLRTLTNDPHVYMVAPTIGAGKINFVIKHVHRNIELFHKHQREHYYERIPDIYKLVQDRRIFYLTTPLYKNKSRTDCLIDLTRHEKGLE